VGEITGDAAYHTVEATGLDAALGIGNMMQELWLMPRGQMDANVSKNMAGISSYF
jgi:hypothetical protein